MVGDLSFRALKTGGMLRLSDSWPDTIQVSNEWLCVAADGAMQDGAVAVSGVIGVLGDFTTMTWTSVTFHAENGTATYALTQEGNDFMADRWTGRLVREGD